MKIMPLLSSKILLGIGRSRIPKAVVQLLTTKNSEYTSIQATTNTAAFSWNFFLALHVTSAADDCLFYGLRTENKAS
jgi:hypothetical protein